MVNKQNSLRPGVAIAITCGGLLLLGVLYVLRNKNEDQTPAPNLAKTSITHSVEKPVMTPVIQATSNELKFQISKLTLAGPRPIPVRPKPANAGQGATVENENQQ